MLNILGAAIKRAFGWLANMVNVCNDKMGAPYQKCKASFKIGYDDCK